MILLFSLIHIPQVPIPILLSQLIVITASTTHSSYRFSHIQLFLELDERINICVCEYAVSKMRIFSFIVFAAILGTFMDLVQKRARDCAYICIILYMGYLMAFGNVVNISRASLCIYLRGDERECVYTWVNGMTDKGV